MAVAEGDPPLYTPEQLVPIFTQLATRLRECKARFSQIFTLGMFVIENGCYDGSGQLERLLT